VSPAAQTGCASAAALGVSGAPFYEIPAGSAASRAIRERLSAKGVQVYDIELVVLSEDFTPALSLHLERRPDFDSGQPANLAC